MDIERLIAFNSITEIIAKLSVSESDLREKAPHKKELIKSISESKEKLTSAYLVLKKTEIDLVAQSKRNFDLERILLEMKSENKLLKDQNYNLLNELKNKF